MSRTIEKVLSIVAAVVNGLMLLGFASFFFLGFAFYFDDSVSKELDLSAMQASGWGDMLTIILLVSGFIFLLVSIILPIIGSVKIDNNAKSAGILFLISALFSGIFSLSGILLMIAGIMALTRNPSAEEVNPYNTMNI